jgi:hypothetical protein
VTAQVSTIPAPASTGEAIDMMLAALRHLAAADPAALAAQAQAECLIALEQGDAISVAARARFLAAFTASQGYAADADYSPASWLIHRTGVTKGAARGHVGWARRVVTHPRVVAALAEGSVLTESVARAICGWTDKLPESCRDAADGILVGAAGAGATAGDLAALAAEIYARSLPDPPEGSDLLPDFEDRKLRVATTFGGAGVISGDLTGECAAVVQTVLDALAAPAGAADTRSKDQRYHDALADAMRRLVASGLLPERAGQPVRVWAHVSLAELRALDDGSVLAQEWIAEMAVRWAARRAAASETGSDGAAWLTGNSVGAVSCDASVIPVVTGQIDPAALDELVGLCLQYAGHGPHCAGPVTDPARDPAAQTGQPAGPPAGTSQPEDNDSTSQPEDHDSTSQPEGHGGAGWAGLGPPGPEGLEMVRHAIIGQAVDLVSGPGGLASFLRTRLLGARLAGPSLPLDVGHSADIPAAIRRAVILRDQHCRWAGGYFL